MGSPAPIRGLLVFETVNEIFWTLKAPLTLLTASGNFVLSLESSANLAGLTFAPSHLWFAEFPRQLVGHRPLFRLHGEWFRCSAAERLAFEQRSWNPIVRDGWFLWDGWNGSGTV